MKPVYAFDIDGVLCLTRYAHREALEREIGVTLRDGGDHESFGFWHPDSYVQARIKALALELWREVVNCGKAAVQGEEVIARLRAENRLAGYVTRRNSDLSAATESWLRRYEFLSADEPVLHARPGENKAWHVRLLGATHLVEDSPHEAWAAACEGVDVTLLRADYNAKFEQQWQQQRAELSGPEADIWGRIDFISSLEELL